MVFHHTLPAEYAIYGALQTKSHTVSIIS